MSLSWRGLTRPLRAGAPHRRRNRVIAGAAALVVLAAVAVTGIALARGPGYHAESRMITVRTGPHRDQPVGLDTTLYVPDGVDAAHPAPAVLLAHGFGGDKDSVKSNAKDLVGQGFVVLAWTAQGFGKSGGQIHLDSPDWEVNDARGLIDWLGHRSEVRRDGADDPRVAVVGGSYGGALALLTAGYDHRVDAIVPEITWNDLGRSLFPNDVTSNDTGGPTSDGVLKKTWLGNLFRSGLGAGPVRGREPGTLETPGCGRFAPDLCALYQQVMTSGRADAATLALLERSSPETILDRIKAPTLLIQGISDTLFPLAEADANARGIAAAGTPVQVAWFSGGHDGGDGSNDDQLRTKYLTLTWLDHYLKGTGPAPGHAFTYSRIVGVDTYDGTIRSTALGTGSYPGLDGDRAAGRVALTGRPLPVANPPNGTPAAISTVPGAGLLSAATAGELPGQAVAYRSEELTAPVDLAGSATVPLRATSPTGQAVLFVKLYDVAPNGKVTLVGGQAAPVRLTGLPTGMDEAALATAKPVTVTLPGMVYRFGTGHRVEVVADTADQAYAGPTAPTSYLVALGGALTVPRVAGSPITDPAGVWYWVLGAVALAILLGVLAAVLVARWRRSRARRSVVAEYADVPLVIKGLRKTYKDGFVAVKGVDFTVERGQVVGLLGPNGAGKTTSLRMLLGLIQPTGGEALVFGYRVAAGSPVLSRIGALVEGPGFLPHLSGLDNLRMYWRSTGRPWDDAGFDDVLEIAGLGDAIHRRVKAYSHGMKQRLAIAQAMLGMPELLVLDEPTDGLDPPQIAEMRRVLQRYATGGRAVLVSSHLLAEVEQTCTHVVVMSRGERVASGPVAEIIGDSPSVLVAVSDVDTAEPVLAGLPGVQSVDRQDGALVVNLNGTPRRDMIDALVSAGVGVDRVVPRRRLEDAFLALLERGSE
jgi:ABC-2 type transport system ATP-binding protein